MRRSLLSLLCFCLGMMAKAEATDISQYENVIYAQPLTAAPGSTVTMSVMMNNNAQIPAYQFDLVLPDGITIARDADGRGLVRLSTERTTASRTDLFRCAEQTDGSMRVLCGSTTNECFSGTEGEVCTVELNIAEDMVEGDYPIILKNIVLSKLDGSTAKHDRIESTLTVSNAVVTYDRGYIISIDPFAVTPGTNYTMVLNFDAKDENITDIEFDMELPSFMSRTKSGRVTKPFDSADENRMYVYGTEGDHTISINGQHVAITAITDDEYKYIAGTSGALMNMYYTAAAEIEDGLYPIRLKNVRMTDGDGNRLSIAPTTSYIKVGNPTNATLDLEGHVTSRLNDALANETAIGTLDMSKVVSMDGTLVLKDKLNFVAPNQDVEADAVTYARTTTSKWGTICLPFEVESDAQIRYYKLKNVTEDLMTFEPITKVEAGSPAVFKKLGGDNINISAQDVTISAGKRSTVLPIGEWTMKGTYTAISMNPADKTEEDIYYISKDKFWYANQTFPIAAFRGWFETPKGTSLNARVFSIFSTDDETTGISMMENENGVVEMRYDLSGRRISGAHKGISIMKNKKYLTR